MAAVAPVVAAVTARSRVATLVAVVVTMLPLVVVELKAAPLLPLAVVVKAQRLPESSQRPPMTPLLLPLQRLLVVKPSLVQSARSQSRYPKLLRKSIVTRANCNICICR